MDEKTFRDYLKELLINSAGYDSIGIYAEYLAYLKGNFIIDIRASGRKVKENEIKEMCKKIGAGVVYFQELAKKDGKIYYAIGIELQDIKGRGDLLRQIENSIGEIERFSTHRGDKFEKIVKTEEKVSKAKDLLDEMNERTLKEVLSKILEIFYEDTARFYKDEEI